MLEQFFTIKLAIEIAIAIGIGLVIYFATRHYYKDEKTIFPSTIVITGLPFSFQPAKGVLRERDLNLSGFLFVSFENLEFFHR